jgi:hypothetical protein
VKPIPSIYSIYDESKKYKILGNPCKNPEKKTGNSV